MGTQSNLPYDIIAVCAGHASRICFLTARLWENSHLWCRQPTRLICPRPIAKPMKSFRFWVRSGGIWKTTTGNEGNSLKGILKQRQSVLGWSLVKSRHVPGTLPKASENKPCKNLKFFKFWGRICFYSRGYRGLAKHVRQS
jgi:hypothetical protein